MINQQYSLISCEREFPLQSRNFLPQIKIFTH